MYPEKVTLLKKKDLKEVNELIRAKFGCRMTSGSIIHRKDGSKCFNIVTENYHTTFANNIQGIGEIIKETFRATEVRYFGVTIA